MLREPAARKRRGPGTSHQMPPGSPGWIRAAAAAARAEPSATAATPPPYGCRVYHDKRAGPPSAALGADLGITLTAWVECIPHPPHLHIAIVIDQSEVMAGWPLSKAKADARQLVEYLIWPSVRARSPRS